MASGTFDPQDIPKQRNALADALDAAAKLADTVPCFNWDVPASYIADECRKWARNYRVRRGK